MIDFFSDNSYLYLPNLSINNINYCFEIKGDTKGYLSEDGIKKVKMNDYEQEEQFIENLEKSEIIKGDFAEDFENKKNKIMIYLKQIKILFKNYKEIKFINYLSKFDWLNNNIEDFKNTCLDNPNKLVIKKKFESLLNFNREIEKNVNKDKIIAKALYATYEVQKKAPTKYFETPFEEIFQKIKYKKGDYNYRIMELYNLKIFRDNSSHTMILILDTIIDILSLTFSNKISEITNIDNQLEELFTELINESLTMKEPIFHNLKALNIINILIQNVKTKYESNFKNEQDEMKISIKEKIKNLSNFIDTQMHQQIVNDNKKLNEKYEKENDKLKKIKEQYVKIKENYEKENNKKISDKEFKLTKEYIDFKQKIKYDTNLLDMEEEIKKRNEFKKILEELIEIKNIDDINLISKKISQNNIQLGISFLDSTIYNKCKNKLYELNELLEKFKNLNIINEIKSYKDIKKYNFSDKIFEQKELLLKLTNYEPNIFKINEFPDKNENGINLVINDELEKYLNKNFNFILTKGNNPIFLYKNIVIDLGILVRDCYDKEEIGSIIIHNNFKGKLKYKIESDKNGYIIINNENSIKNLKSFEDLKIIFKKKDKMNEGLHKTKFKITLYNYNDNNYKYDCDMEVYILPLILQFSLNKEKSSFDENLKKISIHHYIQDFKINHFLPGGISSKSLGIFLKKKYSQDKIDIFNEKEGILRIDPKEERNNFNFTLSLINPLINFEIDFQKPKISGLILFNENEIQIKKRKICRGNEKKLYMFNMSNSIQSINFVFDDNKMEITKDFETINPGEIKEFKIKNKNIINNEIVKINDISIIIENVKEDILNITSKKIDNEKSYKIVTISKAEKKITLENPEVISEINKGFFFISSF